MSRLSAAHYTFLTKVQQRPNRQYVVLPNEDRSLINDLVQVGKMKVIQDNPFTVEAEPGW